MRITLDQLAQEVAGKSPLIDMMALQRGPAAALHNDNSLASQLFLRNTIVAARRPGILW